MRLNHIILESAEIDPQPGSVFMIDYTSFSGDPEPDRLTIIATFEAETPRNSRIKSSHCLVTLAYWECLMEGKPVKSHYGFYCFALEEGIGGRLVPADNVVWVVNFQFAENQGMREFAAAKEQSWVPDFACGYEVHQIR